MPSYIRYNQSKTKLWIVLTNVVPAGSPEVVVPAIGRQSQFYYVASLSIENSRVADFILSSQAGELIPGILKNK